jgi:DNA-binding transcriptional ArsR family regulator
MKAMGPLSNWPRSSTDGVDHNATVSATAMELLDQRRRRSGPADGTPAVSESDDDRVGETIVTSPGDLDLLFEVLNNRSCRSILRTIGDRTLTASEIEANCDVPLSTIYRHLDRLEEANLLGRSLRLESHGQFPSQYARRFDVIEVSLADDQFNVRIR